MIAEHVSAVRRSGVPPAIVGAIAAAWAAAIAAQMMGAAEVLHHDALIDRRIAFPAAAAAFLAAWQLMIVSMMLPSSLPLVRLFRVAAAKQAHPSAVTAALLAGYAAIWSAFGLIAFILDGVVHRVVERWAWLDARPGLIAGSVLLLAGAFQFSNLKDRCLRECRHPAPFLLAHYRRGTRAALRLGISHGMFCLGCCWALMLVGFAAGVASLWWMAALTAIMVYEKTGRHGRDAVVPVGLGLLLLGVVTLL